MSSHVNVRVSALVSIPCFAITEKQQHSDVIVYGCGGVGAVTQVPPLQLPAGTTVSAALDQVRLLCDVHA